MIIKADNVEEYIENVPPDRKTPVITLRENILKNIPEGFEETISYNMIGYVVPHSLYPAGYHCTPKLPLPFMNIASQKNFIAIYHMGLYADSEINEWFRLAYTSLYNTKPDMGKGCVRFKKMDKIPFELIGELAGKISVQDWIDIYERSFVRK
ncbi:DUF1801 domain-containing protein [Sphingobacterium spiritivorum]|uniref:YdhG-like domain-containing protein n=1 Tax=Sphingobacterium spiritivorum ATCC 33861 TaxID=525373 RepID=D7VJ21_SPHSI|nr:DUF1801 domain-containing protein [Sphingobacterium spiritivorum]EFK59156.1 hypothetical protein HMPREF0766_10990 [Sphingobacterium spiritivorum ATCC 33861]QQT34203.1 DUF1801 domain-containing protein [Sphingobacterium spiritivorum]WQD35041.1 DUF1801 domain-containing protein [Sphingobacterium spiritivorum]SUI99258.1 Domain of uncharacterised function (DU1801) [Sphingobacterium spiritivorum]